MKRRRALLTQRNIEEAARSIDVVPKTLLRWLQVPEFNKAHRQARRDAFGQAVARLQQGTSAAATTLLKTMIDPNTPASVRVRAAEAIFKHAAKAVLRLKIPRRAWPLWNKQQNCQRSRDESHLSLGAALVNRRSPV